MIDQQKELYDEAQNLRNNGRVDEAITKYHELIKMAEGDKRLVGYAWQMIGVCQNIGDRRKEAERSFNKAINLFKGISSDLDLGAALRDLGALQAHQERFSESKRSYEESLNVLEKTADPVQLGITMTFLGKMYLKTGNLEEARRWLTGGLKTIQKRGDWFMEMSAYLQLGQLEFKVKNYELGLSHLWAGLGIIYEKGDNDLQKRRLAEIYGFIGKGYQATGAVELGKKYLGRMEGLLAEMPAEAAGVVRKSIERIS